MPDYKLNNQLNISMEQRPSSEANSHMVVSKLPEFQVTRRSNIKFTNSPSLDTLLSQMSPILTLQTYFSTIHFHFFYLRVGLRSGLLPSGLPIKVFIHFLCTSCTLYSPPISYSFCIQLPTPSKIIKLTVQANSTKQVLTYTSEI